MQRERGQGNRMRDRKVARKRERAGGRSEGLRERGWKERGRCREKRAKKRERDREGDRWKSERAGE